ncbi:hypothetical protein MNV49_007065 [Pseudohyphozyma bogoriensis]|nr:hypothetical protein MNV49_007065 [Pseudohyphozyma bogoriensis]
MPGPKDRAGGKTRTSSAHGPSSAKKPYKASSAPTPSSGTTKKPYVPKTGPAPVTTKRAREEDEPEKAVVKSSLLSAPEEIDFVRGGGSGLTQVEVREAVLEGEKEAKDEEDEEEKERKLQTEVPEKSKAKRRKLERELAATKIREKHALPKDAFRVEHLNYKRLVPGTKVLAQIISVRPLELIVSLPNQLLAHIPITNISPEFTARLEAADEEDDSSDEESDDEESTVPTLAGLFKEGDWISTVVVDQKEDWKTRTGGREGDENVRASRRVELSAEPEKVNEGIAKGDLRAGFTLTASIKSVEDHGYVLSLGLPSLSSFLPFKEALKLQPRKLEVGQLIGCRIKEVNENGKTCTVAVGRAEVINSTLSTATSITSILPSTLVSALVTATLPSGLNVKFHGFFDGSIDIFHLNSLDPEKAFKIGQKVKARVLWDSVGTTPKRFSLSLAEHIIKLGVQTVGEGEEAKEVKEEYPVGRTLEEVKIVRSDEEWGLTCEWEEEGAKVSGFVHISHITDDHLASIPKSGPWKIGTLHRARVVGYSAVDGLVQLSLQPSVLEKSFLRVSDVKVGDVIKGTVRRLNDNGLFVEISGNVDGVVWPMHYADIKLKHPEKKFKAGTSVKARILSANPVKNRVVLTLKRQLVTSELPIVATAADAKVGVVTHATVTKVLEKSVLVDFFGGLRALIPATEAAEGFSSTTDLARIFTIGKVIPVRIINVDLTTGRIVASARQAVETAPEAAAASVEIGNVLSGEISALHETNIVLSLIPSKVKALISYPTLARHRKVTVEALRGDLAKGQTLEDLVVVSKNDDKGFVIVGLVPSKAKKSEDNAHADTVATNLSFESLAVGQKVAGRVCGKIPGGILVQVSRSIRGRVPQTEISDDYDLLSSASVAMGAHVECKVLSIDAENRRVDLSLRASRLDEKVVPKDALIKTVEDVKVGQPIRGFIKNIANHGLFVSLGGDVTARIQIKELFDEYVKEWKPRFSVGQLVSGKIIAVNKEQNQVELSLRSTATVKETAVEIGDLAKGQIVRGVVKRVEEYGAFIRIEGSSISGLCHKSKVTDDESTAWTEFVHEGDKVEAIITDVNVETKKISLGLKKSLFPGGDESEEEEGSEEEDEDDDDDEEGSDEEEEEEDSEGDVVFGADSDDDDVAGADSDDEMEIELPVASTSKLPAKVAAPLAVNAGFKWDAEEESEDEAENADEMDDEDEEEKIEEPASKKQKKADLSTLEDRTGDLDSQAPTSVADFERLLLGSPNSSYLWIQFIAFYVGISQVDKAREIGRRALKTINFREEQEKLNVWVALLNLENSYGTETSLEELFKEAVQSNDAKTVYLRLVDIYERTGKFEAEEELFKKLVKKFGQSSKAWTLFGQFYLTRGRPDEARELLPRSLKSLEKRKHVKTISKFAQLEFKLGDAERGRTIFEGIMDSYPKRLDLWFVYVDMEIKQRNVAGVRALFDRILAQRLSSKKGKSVFKKWLTFEKEFGDEAGVNAVKERAVAFVESLAA